MGVSLLPTGRTHLELQPRGPLSKGRHVYGGQTGVLDRGVRSHDMEVVGT